MTLTLNLSHESSRRTAYETMTSRVGGTATGGTDYENFLSGGEARITVPAGDTQATLDITITDDTAAESSETITIRWDNDPTGISNGDATPSVINFTGTITDNDSGVQMTIQDASADESSSSIAFRIDLQRNPNPRRHLQLQHQHRSQRHRRGRRLRPRKCRKSYLVSRVCKRTHRHLPE